MESEVKSKWEWDDLLEMIYQTENESISTDILSDEIFIHEDFMKCKLGYKRNFHDLLGELKDSNVDFHDTFNRRLLKKFKFS